VDRCLPRLTGGGIKTSTLAVAVLNFFSLVKGKDRVEAFGREITTDSIRRSSAIIFLSLFTLALSVFALSITDSSIKLLDLAFESVSAFSTVGLSLGITPALSKAGRIILALVMFIGRVGTLTMVIAFIKKTNKKKYRYPQEKVLF
jgi:Trk-type K+ transport system membrane component